MKSSMKIIFKQFNLNLFFFVRKIPEVNLLHSHDNQYKFPSRVSSVEIFLISTTGCTNVASPGN